MSIYKDILQKYWGYTSFRPLQEEIIRSITEKRDTLGLMPTGGGKSITFQVPALMHEGICLVVTPLIALMKDQVDNLRRKGIKAAAVYTGMSREEIIITLENCIFGNYKFLYVSPERLSSQIFLQKMHAMHVSILVVDEAHCISQWGYDFRPAYLKIAEIRPFLPDVPVLALTATATPEVIKDIQKKLLFKKENVFTKSFLRSNLAYIVRMADNKIPVMLRMLEKVPGTAIVYVRSRKKTKEVATNLQKAGIQAGFFHAGLLPEEKEQTQNEWMKGTLRVIVSTNAFGMGIDKPDVRLVIHLDLPNSPEEYFQEAGRAGRDGNKAYAVILYDKNDSTKLKKRVSDEFPERALIRRVYDALGSYFQVAVGSGYESMHDFDLNAFCAIFKFSINQAYNAIRILEQSGYLGYIEDPGNRSRLKFTVLRDDLYKLNSFDEKTDKLIQIILRSYTGVFSDYAFISEKLLANRCQLSVKEVYDRLIKLSKEFVISYIPQKRMPVIVYTQSREESCHLIISRNIYEERKSRLAKRIEAMLFYAENQYFCRSKILLSYFGEINSSECDVCDVCLSRKQKKLGSSDFMEIEKILYHILEEKGETALNELVDAVAYPENFVLQVIRFLTDEEIIRNNAGLLSLRKREENKKG